MFNLLGITMSLTQGQLKNKIKIFIWIFFLSCLMDTEGSHLHRITIFPSIYGKKRPYFKGQLALVIFWLSWTVVLEKTLESLLDCKQIKPVNPKGYQPWIFIGKTDAEAPIHWPPDAKSQLIRKDPDAGKDWRQEEKGMTEWDGWMASPNQWTWVWASSRSCWRTGRPGVLQSMGSQIVRHDWRTTHLELWSLLECLSCPTLTYLLSILSKEMRVHLKFYVSLLSICLVRMHLYLPLLFNQWGF